MMKKKKDEPYSNLEGWTTQNLNRLALDIRKIKSDREYEVKNETIKRIKNLKTSSTRTVDLRITFKIKPVIDYNLVYPHFDVKAKVLSDIKGHKTSFQKELQDVLGFWAEDEGDDILEALFPDIAKEINEVNTTDF